MKTFRVYYIRDGINYTKLVYAESKDDILAMFEGVKIFIIKEIDTNPLEDLE